MIEKIKTDEVAGVLNRPQTKKIMPIAIIVDEHGAPIYHIVSTKWSNVALIIFTGLLLILVMLAGLVYFNQTRLDRLEGRQDAGDARQKEGDARQNKSDARQNKSDVRQDEMEANTNANK